MLFYRHLRSATKIDHYQRASTFLPLSLSPHTPRSPIFTLHLTPSFPTLQRRRQITSRVRALFVVNRVNELLVGDLCILVPDFGLLSRSFHLADIADQGLLFRMFD